MPWPRSSLQSVRGRAGSCGMRFNVHMLYIYIYIIYICMYIYNIYIYHIIYIYIYIYNMPKCRQAVCVCVYVRGHPRDEKQAQSGRLLNCKRKKEKRQKCTSATIPEGPTAQSPELWRWSPLSAPSPTAPLSGAPPPPFPPLPPPSLPLSAPGPP